MSWASRFTNENFEHIRGSLALLIVNGCASRHAENDRVNTRDTLAHKHNHFWLWTVLPNATVSVTNTHDWNEAQISSRTQLWWSGVETQTVAGSIGDNHNILVIFLACAFLSVCSQAPHISHEYRDDQRQKMSRPSMLVMVAPTIWVSPLIITGEIVTLTWFFFSARICHDYVSAELISVKKKSWHSDWPSDGRKNVTKHALVTPLVLSIISDYHNWVRDADMDFVSVRFFVRHWQWHFAALVAFAHLLLYSFRSSIFLFGLSFQCSLCLSLTLPLFSSPGFSSYSSCVCFLLLLLLTFPQCIV